MARSEVSDNLVSVSSEDITDPRKRQIIENAMVKQKNTKKNNQAINKGSLAYISKDNVKGFNKEIQKKLFNPSGIGRPYAFSSLKQLEEDMGEYFETCDKYNIMPTNLTLALWLGVDVDTLSNHANNPNSPFFRVMKNTKAYLHGLMQGGTLAGEINPVTYIFLSKNYYGMRDDKNIQVTTQGNQPLVNSQETMSAIQKQIEEENAINAEVVSEK